MKFVNFLVIVLAATLAFRANKLVQEENKQVLSEDAEGQKAVLLFDGVCNLCNGVVTFVMKRDSKDRVLFAPLQSKKGTSDYCFRSS